MTDSEFTRDAMKSKHGVLNLAVVCQDVGIAHPLGAVCQWTVQPPIFRALNAAWTPPELTVAAELEVLRLL